MFHLPSAPDVRRLRIKDMHLATKLPFDLFDVLLVFSGVDADVYAPEFVRSLSPSGSIDGVDDVFVVWPEAKPKRDQGSFRLAEAVEAVSKILIVGNVI